MRIFCFFCALIPLMINAQKSFNDISQIPLPPIGLVEKEHPWIMPYYEELLDDFVDKNKVGKNFREMARKSYTNKLFIFDSEDLSKCQSEAFEFYKISFGKNLFLSKSPQDHKEINLSQLKNGEQSEVVFTPSWFGGGIFLWYAYNNDELRRLSITIGQGITIVEQIYTQGITIIEPTESEIYFPKYPGSSFAAKESGYTHGIYGSPKIMEIAFKTTDTVEEVISFFEMKVKTENPLWERPKREVFKRQIQTLDWSLWPTLNIYSQIDDSSNQNFGGSGAQIITIISYRYPIPINAN